MIKRNLRDKVSFKRVDEMVSEELYDGDEVINSKEDRDSKNVSQNGIGWIKLHRKMFENPIVMKDADHLAVWIYLLGSATYTECPALFKGKKIMLQPGQLITGRKIIAEKLTINESKVRRILDNFEDDQQIDRQRSNQNTLVTLVNWEKYQNFDQQNDQRMTSRNGKNDTLVNKSQPENDQQSDQQKDIEKTLKSSDCEVVDDESDQQSDQRATNERPTSDQRATTNNNIKNIKNIINIYSENEVLNEALLGFIEHRKGMDKPMTDKGIKLLMEELNKLSSDVNEQIEILNQSIVNGWTRIFPLKKQNSRTKGNKYNNFHQRKYDPEEYEKMLLTTSVK